MAILPCASHLADNDHLMLNPVSAQYTTSSQQFTTSAAYRDYVSQHKNKPGFFFHPLHLYRYTGKDQMPVDKLEAEQLNALLGVDLLLLFSDVILSPGYTYADTYQTGGYSSAGPRYYDANGHRLND